MPIGRHGSLALAGIAVALAACNAARPPAPRNAAGNFLLPSVESGDACAGIGTDAVLVGDGNDPQVAWLVTASGQRMDVVFPEGLTARFTPELEVLDPSGVVVARALDHVGGYCTRGTGRPPLVLFP